MHIRVIKPNTNSAMTDTIGEAAKTVAAPRYTHHGLATRQRQVYDREPFD